ncbi:uncharacterized protein KZ484_009346 isoform 2-T2 [Pholidichthys leucotaenia]
MQQSWARSGIDESAERMYLWRFSVAITLGLVWYFSDCGRVISQYFLCFIFCLTTPLVFGNVGRENSTQTDEDPEERPLQEPAPEESCVDGGSPEQSEPLKSQYSHVKTALKQGLGLLVTWLSDPDNLNQLVVSQLTSVSLKSSLEELGGTDLDQVSLASQDSKGEGEGSDVSLHGAGISTANKIKGKRKGNKLKEGWSKFVDKMKSKKAKKKKKIKKIEQELMMRAMAMEGDQSNEDNSKEDSVQSQDEDSDREDSDLENYLKSVEEDMIEFKLSYEMWRVGRWTVSIPHAGWEDEELIFTIHIEEKDSPENLQWDIKKTYMDVIHFRNRWQDSTSLPTILELELEESAVTDEVKEEARASVAHFLQELVSDNLIGHTQPIFQFLCPLDKLLNEEEHYGGVWGLFSGLAYFLTPSQEEEESSCPPSEALKENTIPQPESTAASAENRASSVEEGGHVLSASLPTIVVSQCEDFPSQSHEEAEAEMDTHTPGDSDSSNYDNSQDKTEDSDNPLTSHFKMIFKGLARTRSQESLNAKKSGVEDPPDLQRESTEGPSWLHFPPRSPKKEKVSFSFPGVNKPKGKETQVTLQRGEDSHSQKSQVNWEQLEATKAIFDLLKEISGNSILLNIFDAILKPVMPILKKKVNSFLNKVNPTETQMAAYIDTLRSKLWPEVPRATAPPRSEEEKEESRDQAHSLINARYSNVIFLKKTDMEYVFNLFQDREKNKTLVYMLLSFLLKEFLSNEPLKFSTTALLKVTSPTTS